MAEEEAEGEGLLAPLAMLLLLLAAGRSKSDVAALAASGGCV